MFQNNEYHEDGMNIKDNLNYSEKNFEKEFYDSKYFNFYLYLNFDFEKISNKKTLTTDINRIINNEETRFNLDNEIRNERKNINNYDKNKSEEKEILNILLKFNFNHKNNNGKIFLNFFEELKEINNKNQKFDVSMKNKENNFNSFLDVGNNINEEFSLEALKNEYLKSLNNSNISGEKGNLFNEIKKGNLNKNKNFEYKKEIIDDPLDKYDYQIKNLERNYREVTIKEKKLLFLKLLNNIIYNSCYNKKLLANEIKENLRKILFENFNLYNNITDMKNKIYNLQSNKINIENLFKESEIVQSEKASIKQLEMNQIKFYKNIIGKIDKSFIRDYQLIKREEKILAEKIKNFKKEKKKFNFTQKIQFEKEIEKENAYYEMKYLSNQIIKMQSELIDNKNILNMINNDKDLILNKIDTKSKRKNKNKNEIFLLTNKIENLIADKNKTEGLIEINFNRKAQVNKSIDDDNEKLNEIEKKIKELLEQKKKIIEQVNIKQENLEKIETENLINENTLFLINSNLNYLRSSLKEKQINFNNLNKNIESIKNDLKKIKEKENIFTYHIDFLNFSINNLTKFNNIFRKKTEILINEIKELNLNQKVSSNRILNAIEEINSIQSNLNKYNLNYDTNMINKKNYQINIKNTVDNLIKENVLDGSKKYYEYLDGLELKEINDNINQKGNNTFDKDISFMAESKLYKKEIKKSFNDYNIINYRKTKEKLFKDLIQDSTTNFNKKLYSKVEFKENDNINFKNNTNKIENQNIEDTIISDLDLSKHSLQNFDSKILDDYIIIDYNTIFDDIGNK